MIKAFKLIAITFLFMMTFFVGLALFHRLGFTYENGKHFDEENVRVYEEQSIPVYAMIFIICLLLSIILSVNLFKSIRK